MTGYSKWKITIEYSGPLGFVKPKIVLALLIISYSYYTVYVFYFFKTYQRSPAFLSEIECSFDVMNVAKNYLLLESLKAKYLISLYFSFRLLSWFISFSSTFSNFSSPFSNFYLLNLQILELSNNTKQLSLPIRIYKTWDSATIVPFYSNFIEE